MRILVIASNCNNKNYNLDKELIQVKGKKFPVDTFDWELQAVEVGQLIAVDIRAKLGYDTVLWLEAGNSLARLPIDEKHQGWHS